MLERCWSKLTKKARRFLVLFFNASVFLTRLPAPQWVPFNNGLLRLSAVYFPLVGVMGGFLGALMWCVLGGLFPVPLALVLTLCFCIYLTGAFHEDGWADSCDALGGGYSKEAVLKIMKDSRLGTYGVVGLLGMLAVKFLSLWVLAEQYGILSAGLLLVVGQGLSRWFALAVMATLRYVRDDFGKSKPLAHSISLGNLVWAACPVIVVSAWAVYSTVLTTGVMALAFLVAYGFVVYFARQLKKAIGGYTGDGLGAVQQLSEVGFYLALIALQGV